MNNKSLRDLLSEYIECNQAVASAKIDSHSYAGTEVRAAEERCDRKAHEIVTWLLTNVISISGVTVVNVGAAFDIEDSTITLAVPPAELQRLLDFGLRVSGMKITFEKPDAES